MRGEDVGERKCLLFCAETPPHAWGRHGGKVFLPLGNGNTPTCVGKTSQGYEVGTWRQKHPHMRGEDIPRQKASTFFGETPPHAWGRPGRNPKHAIGVGNTPPCVGKTSLIAMRRKGMAETPPHAWGRLRQSGGDTRKSRNTPTCVGKTGLLPSL